jgi:hypothetical protein
MSMTFCYQWNDLLRAPRDPYSEAAARRRHDRGELYTAVLGEAEAPRVLVEVSLEAQWSALHLLDDGRRWRAWSFDGRPDNERFFLEEYRGFHFDAEGNKRYSDLVYFSRDGLLKVEEVDLLSKDVYSYDIHADVSDLWTAPPSFGDYESITRFESLDPFAGLPREAPWSKAWSQS